MKSRFLFTLASSSLIILVSSTFFPGTAKTTQKQTSYLGCTYSDLSGNIDFTQKSAFFEGREVNLPKTAFDQGALTVLGTSQDERWIEVDLSDQRLSAWEGQKLFIQTPVSTGLPWYPTPTGEFRIWIKLRATKMEGGQGKNYYYLPNVPYVMFFANSQVPSWKGYGLHGTYWHNDFGRVRSHGCVNLPTEIAKELYYWTDPSLPEGKSLVRADQNNSGTKIVIHD